MKGLYLRGGVWWVRFTPGPKAAQVRMSTGEVDEAVAIGVARRLMDEAGAEVRAAAGSCAAEMEAYLAAMRTRRGLAKSTVQLRRDVLKIFVQEMGVQAPGQVGAAGLQRWFDGRWKMHPPTATTYLNIVRGWFNWLAAERKVSVNPARDIKVPKMPMQKRRPFLRPAEARAVIDGCERLDLKFVLYCGMQEGLRKLEVVEAVPEWFDLEEGLIHLDTTGPAFEPVFELKDRDKRTVPMTKEFQEWLRKVYLKDRPRWKKEPYMLHPEKVRRGRHRYRWEFRQAYVKHMKGLELGHVTFHDLRRTFASLLVSKGVSIYKVAKWLGDDVKVVQERYGHLIPKDEDIDAAWSSGKTRGGKKGRRGERE